jgi:hypothetical protein
MATQIRDEDEAKARVLWLRYAIELGQRGLWPVGEIEVREGADVYGEAQVSFGAQDVVQFHLPAGSNDDDLEDLEVSYDDLGELKEFHRVPPSELHPELAKRIDAAESELEELLTKQNEANKLG